MKTHRQTTTRLLAAATLGIATSVASAQDAGVETKTPDAGVRSPSRALLADAGAKENVTGQASAPMNTLSAVAVDAGAREVPEDKGYLALKSDAGVQPPPKAAEPSEPSADAELRERIQARLQDTRGLSMTARLVKVKVDAGKVTLSGGVNTVNEKLRVEQVTSSVEGVSALKSDLRVRNRMPNRPLARAAR